MSRGLVRGAVVEVIVEKAVYLGQGLARHEGQVVFVPRGHPGERVRVRIEEAGRGYARGRIEARLAPSASRRESPCPHFDQCGGCSYQDLAYDEQLRLKEAVLHDALQRAGLAWEGERPIVPSPEEGWRTRCTMHVSATGEGVALGFFEEKTHRVVDAQYCRQLSPALNDVARSLRAALSGRPGAGGVREIELAESMDGTRRVAVLDAGDDMTKAVALATVGEDWPALTGFAVSVGGRLVATRGDLHVEAAVRGFRLRSHIRSFFQANRFLVPALVDEVLGLVPPGGTVLDLYCGVGLFSLPLSVQAERVRGLEIADVAAADAQANVGAAGLESRIEIRRADVTRGLPWPVEPEERVVLDPPRTGAGPAVVEAVVARRPATIVYVSCDPPTLARDLRALTGRGYGIRSLRGFDLFPDTFHLETVVQLTPL